MKTACYVEYYGRQVSEADVIAMAKKIWADAGNKAADLKDIKLYIKPEDDRIYYVFNNTESGSFSFDDTQNNF